MNETARMSADLAATAFEPLPKIARRMRLWGIAVEENDEQLTFRRDGFAGGLCADTDPVNRAVILAMSLVGEIWPRAFPSLLKEVNQRWTAQRKARKTNDA